MSSINMIYIMAVYFFAISVFGGSQHRKHSVIIFLFCLLNFISPVDIANTDKEYIFNRNVSLIYDIANCMLMLMLMAFDKYAWKQAGLLAFAVLCHVMIIYRLTIEYTLISHLFHSYYDELIILIALAQMAVSYDGFVRALTEIRVYTRSLREIRVLLRRLYTNILRSYMHIQTFIKKKG